MTIIKSDNGDQIIFKSDDGFFIAEIYKWDAEYCVTFIAFGRIDYQFKGSYGTGSKSYSTKDKAIAAAKRYIKKFEK